MEMCSYFTRPDLTYNNYYKPSPIEMVYNTILIPISDYPEIENYNLPKKISIHNKRSRAIFDQSIVFDNGIVEFNSIKYKYFYIAPGIKVNNKNLEKKDLILKLDNYTIDLNLLFTNSNSKLLIGLLVLSSNYYYLFNHNDDAFIYINSQKFPCSILNKYNKYNYYMPRTINTIIDIMHNKNIDIFYQLNNNNIITLAKIQSKLVTKSSNKGQIVLTKLSNSNIDYSVKCIGVDNNYNKDYNMSGRRLYINNLSKGKYKVNISNNLGQNESLTISIGGFNDNIPTRSSLTHFKDTVLNPI